MNLKIHDRTRECDDGKHRARLESPKGITIHCFGPWAASDMLGVAKFYQRPENLKYTGGQNPYTYGLLENTGFIEKALPIDEIGPHALRWSSPTIGVVFFGEFSRKPPERRQWDMGIDLVAELCAALGFDPLGKDPDGIYIVEGHTKRPSATGDKTKNCPGAAFDLDKFRYDVREIMMEGAIQRLVQAEYI